ncbi:MAG: hypothetical protein EHM89_17815 [Acidobacteria bacterium]|nr:MAG: hypothetical protein EHM89_17815 [Acidobacteriota bacterium]
MPVQADRLRVTAVFERRGSDGWSASIRLTSPVDGSLAVEIFDAAGRRVRAWWDVRTENGAAEITWDGRNSGGRRTGSGVYFVRATTAGAGPVAAKLVRIAQ